MYTITIYLEYLASLISPSGKTGCVWKPGFVKFSHIYEVKFCYTCQNTYDFHINVGFASSFTRNPKNLTVYSDTSRYAFECQIATFVSTEVDLNLMRIEWDGAMNSSEEFQLQDSQFSFSPLPGYSIFVRDINGSSFDMLPDRFRCRAVFTLPNGAEMIVATSDMALIIQMDMIGMYTYM